jgi:hypothetical protein
MGPILAAVVVTEIDGIEPFPSAQKPCGMPDCVLPPAAAEVTLPRQSATIVIVCIKLLSSMVNA